jgi:FAD synthetase
MKVMCFGTFDMFHPGHEAYLREGKALGDSLVVVVARDSTVESVKGAAPRNDENARLSVISDLDYVDKAMLGSEGDKYSVIVSERPDVLFFGYDQDSFCSGVKEKLAALGVDVEVKRAEKGFEVEVFKSSRM